MAEDSSPHETLTRIGWAVGVAIAVISGVGLGLAMNNLWLGAACGLVLGAALPLAIAVPLKKRLRALAPERELRARRMLVIGESLIDRVGESGAEVPGGSPANVALTLGRLGVRPRLLTVLGRDAAGDAIRNRLVTSGVFVDAVAAERTSSSTAFLTANGDARYDFDITWDLEGAEDDALIDHIHTGSLGSYIEPGAEDVARIIAGYRGRASISYDPNIRASLISDASAVRARVEGFVAQADIVTLSEDDAAWLDGQNSIVDRWHSDGVPLVILMRGDQGARVFFGGQSIDVPAVRTRVVDTVGAGDSFTGAVLAEMHRRDLLGARTKIQAASLNDIEEIVRFAVRVAALTVSRQGADPPRRGEIDAS